PLWLAICLIPQRLVRCLSGFATRSAAAAQRPFATCCQNAAASDALRPAAASNSAGATLGMTLLPPLGAFGPGRLRPRPGPPKFAGGRDGWPALDWSLRGR